MVGPVTIPKVGTSWHDMYESIGLHDSPLFAQVRGRKACALHACASSCLHDMVAELRL